MEKFFTFIMALGALAVFAVPLALFIGILWLCFTISPVVGFIVLVLGAAALASTL